MLGMAKKHKVRREAPATAANKPPQAPVPPPAT
jgi:hypothetical protein